MSSSGSIKSFSAAKRGFAAAAKRGGVAPFEPETYNGRLWPQT
jgi:hypothetical protein